MRSFIVILTNENQWFNSSQTVARQLFRHLPVIEEKTQYIQVVPYIFIRPKPRRDTFSS